MFPSMFLSFKCGEYVDVSLNISQEAIELSMALLMGMQLKEERNKL